MLALTVRLDCVTISQETAAMLERMPTEDFEAYINQTAGKSGKEM